MINIAAKARPYFGAVVLSVILLTAGGIYSATRMASGVYPEVTFPRIAVVAKKADLDLSTMELQVTIPIEQAVSTVIGVSSVRAKTIRGSCDISVNFAPGTDMKRAEQMAWNRIGAVRSQLPAEVEITVEQMTPSVSPIISVVLTGGDNPSKLRDYAYYVLSPQIKTIPDVLYSNISGGDVREFIVEARPDDLLAAGLSAADLADQIGKAHRLQPVGRIEELPSGFQILVNTQGTTARQLEELVIGVKNNQPLKVSDVADVKISHQDRVESIGFEGNDAVVLTVYRRLGGNTVKISEGIQELLKRQPPPRGIKATPAYDQSRFITTAVDNVRDAILIGSVFSVLILLAFLRSWRATLISALAIPVTLAITLLFMYWSGETLNLMSLGGLAVAIGLIIDDSVVVIENIARHLAHGENTSGDAIDRASGEITGAVVGSTLTTVLVFVPLAYITGVYGQFFASLSMSLCIAVLVSMVISLTLVPVCAGKFLAGRPMPEPGPIYRAVAHVYDAALGVALAFPWATLALSIGAVGLGVILFTGLPDYWPEKPEKAGGKAKAVMSSTSTATAKTESKVRKALLVKPLETGLMPAMDEGVFVLDYFAPTGTPLKRTEEIARKIEENLLDNPDVHSYVRRTGTQLGLFSTKTDRGDIQVILRSADDDPYSVLTKPVRPPFSEIEHGEMEQIGKEGIIKKYRRRPIVEVMKEIEDEIKNHYGEHQLRVELVQVLVDELDDLAGLNDPIELKFFGPDYKVLRQIAEDVGDTMEKKGKGHGIREVITNVFEGVPDLMVKVDGVKAATFGLTATDVERQLRAIFLGQEATKVRESALRITDVDVRYADIIRFGKQRFNPDIVRDQWILLPVAATAKAPKGDPFQLLTGPARAVPLSALAEVETVRTPDEQVRENQQPCIIVTAQLAEKEAGLGSVVADIRSWMTEKPLPPGYRWELGGHYVMQQEAFRSLTLVMAVAVMLVFIMLAFQFRSMVLPLLIFLTQPLSLVSGLLALWLTHTPLNVSSYMGAILLIGLDMKNGILLVEYIQQLRAEGMELRPALQLAGRTRFRPILMTSLAAILGMLPLALGIGPGAQMQQPLAIMVIGGLTANMLFTRMVIPVGYLVLERGKSAASRAPTAEPLPIMAPVVE